MNVVVDKVLAEELIDMKLKYIIDEISKILERWQYTDPAKFLSDAKDGTIVEAENDAITLVHLLDQQDELFQLKYSWQA
jgi:hypothetical protein